MEPQQARFKDVEVDGSVTKYGEGTFQAFDLKGRPADKSKTGSATTSMFIYCLAWSDSLAFSTVAINFVLLLIITYSLPVSDAASITLNFTGTSFVVAVLGGFVADTFLGYYTTVILGAIIEILGLGWFVFCVTFSGLRPPACTPTLATPCAPATEKYMTPVYVALYAMAIGSGVLKSSIAPFGADQFDETDPVEKKKSVHYFAWLYFFQNFGIFIGFTLCVYLVEYVSNGWGFGWLLIAQAISIVSFTIATPRYRHKKPGGSFITRIVQVWVAAMRKRNLDLPDDSKLYDAPISGGWLPKTVSLRFLDKASIMTNEQEDTTRWRLAGVTQVEETKRILKLIPVWLSTAFIYIVFSPVNTFTVSQGATLDRSIGKHFVVPPSSLGTMLMVISLAGVMIYDLLIVPLLRKFTKNPYGLTPLQRMSVGAFCAIITMISGALVERKRLYYIRELGFTESPFFEVPMSMWWLIPPYLFAGLTELLLIVAQYEFFYHEVSDATRSIGTSFLFSGLGLGYFMSSVLVNLTNSVTKHKPGGAWLLDRLNSGGLENFYWLLTVLLVINFSVFLVAAYFYEYNYVRFIGRDSTELEQTYDQVEH